MNWKRYPLKSLQALAYQARLRGWQTVHDLYLRGHSMCWVKLPFLERLAVLANACPGPILECGSGLSTEVIRRYARKVPKVSLEQHVGWAMKTRALRCPIDWNTGWYGGASFALADRFSLVVVDGPDGGDRAGFLNAIQLAPNAKILVDDTHNWWDGRRVVEEIRKYRPTKSVEVVGNRAYSYSVVTLEA